MESLSSSELAAYMSLKPAPPLLGVESGEPMLRWIWDHEFAAVAGDMVAFEAQPFVSETHILHEWLIAGWGMPIGELFDLERLAMVCKEKKKWNFFFSSVPLKVSSPAELCHKARFLSRCTNSFHRYLAGLPAHRMGWPFCNCSSIASSMGLL